MDQKEHLSQKGAKFSSLMPEKPINAEKEGEKNEKEKTEAIVAMPQIDQLDEMDDSQFWLEDDKKRSQKSEQKKLEEYSKKALLFVGTIYFSINFIGLHP